MDFGFLNAVLQSRFFPPEDPWLSGHAISYYYFGHFMMAFLTQLTGVASSVGYNLALACIPALAGIGAFGPGLQPGEVVRRGRREVGGFRRGGPGLDSAGR